MIQFPNSPEYARSVLVPGPSARCNTYISIHTKHTRPSVALREPSGQAQVARYGCALETGLRFIHSCGQTESRNGQPNSPLVKLVCASHEFCVLVLADRLPRLRVLAGPDDCDRPVSISKTVRCDSMVRIRKDSPSGRVDKRCRYHVAPATAPPMTT